jgi:hypothetical protein
VQIASGFDVENWKELDLSLDSDENWNKGIDVFKRRITERYIEPVDILLEIEAPLAYTDRRFGFSIVAIDCLLIETLQAFIDGRKQTKAGTGSAVFIAYMTENKNLGKFFNKELAKRFYREYRNGLLHQAETQKGSLIWSEFEVVSVLEGKMIINRTELHKLIKLDFEDYLVNLANLSNRELRLNFIHKMKYICHG